MNISDWTPAGYSGMNVSVYTFKGYTLEQIKSCGYWIIYDHEECYAFGIDIQTCIRNFETRLYGMGKPPEPIMADPRAREEPKAVMDQAEPQILTEGPQPKKTRTKKS